MNLEDAIRFYFVFEGLEFTRIYSDIFSAIDAEILSKFNELKTRFEFGEFSMECKTILRKLAKSDRKRFHILKTLPRLSSAHILKLLVQKNIIVFEKSREIPLKREKNHKLKREFRRYQIQDKLHFKDNFTRFWFRFCEPNSSFLERGEKFHVLNLIKAELEAYFSLPFELACIEFLSVKFEIERNEISSFWNKDEEIDIFVENNDFTIVGEVKYKNKKICKDVLNSLINKCDRIGINPDFYVLFSKSGFSEELKDIKNDKILLFELENFKELL